MAFDIRAKRGDGDNQHPKKVWPISHGGWTDKTVHARFYSPPPVKKQDQAIRRRVSSSEIIGADGKQINLQGDDQ